VAGQKRETFEPVTLGHIRSHGCRELLVYCGSIKGNPGVTINADHMSDDTRSGRSPRTWSAHVSDRSASFQNSGSALLALEINHGRMATPLLWICITETDGCASFPLNEQTSQGVTLYFRSRNGR
jgi:hypothetical protein